MLQFLAFLLGLPVRMLGFVLRTVSWSFPKFVFIWGVFYAYRMMVQIVIVIWMAWFGPNEEGVYEIEFSPDEGLVFTLLDQSTEGMLPDRTDFIWDEQPFAVLPRRIILVD